MKVLDLQRVIANLPPGAHVNFMPPDESEHTAAIAMYNPVLKVLLLAAAGADIGPVDRILHEDEK